MRPYSATEAIGPAIERTRQYLFQPLRWGRLLKLTLVALLTEGGASSCNFSGNHFPSGAHPGTSTPFAWPHITLPGIAAIVAISLAVMIVVIPIGIFISYLIIRLRFSFFDCVLNGRDRIGQAWSRYHRQAMRYLGMSLIVGLAVWVVLGAIGFSFWAHYKPLFQAIGSDHSPGFADFLPLIALAVPLFFVLGVALALVETAMRYLVLPRMALEDASIREAVSDVWDDIRTEPGAFFVFWFMKWLVALVGGIIGVIALMVPFLVLVIAGVLIGLILKAISTTLLFLLGIPALVLAGAAFFLAIIMLSGTIGTFRRNYAILFYAGRLPQMAAIL
jgi:hypothetical protein